jgi:hypothetical protein
MVQWATMRAVRSAWSPYSLPFQPPASCSTCPVDISSTRSAESFGLKCATRVRFAELRRFQRAVQQHKAEGRGGRQLFQGFLFQLHDRRRFMQY